MERIIIVNSTATRSSGALAIYKQFIIYLERSRGENQYYVFVDSTMPQPYISGVTYIRDDNHSWKHRIYWDFWGCRRWLKRKGLAADVYVSLQNTGIITKCKQVIYYHNSIPFYKNSWNIFKKSERVMALYKYVYPLIVALTLNRKTDVVVQIPFMKEAFVRRFGIDESRVHVLFPDLENIDVEKVEPIRWADGCRHYIYPATYFPYKEHQTLVEALAILKKKEPSIAETIRIHLTLDKEQVPCLTELIIKKNVTDNFVFEGLMPHETLLSMYKASDGLLFPSTIETLGLPLIEAARFGLPVLVADLPYAHDVMSGYDGAQFIAPVDYSSWAKAIAHLSENPCAYTPLTEKDSSWKQFFEIVNK